MEWSENARQKIKLVGRMMMTCLNLIRLDNNKYMSAFVRYDGHWLANAMNRTRISWLGALIVLRLARANVLL